MSTGRPSSYSDAVAQEICERLAAGQSLRQICRDKHLPHRGTVLKWLYDKSHPGFHDQYARARERQLEVWADEIMDIVDDGSNDWMEIETDKGRIKKVLDNEHVQRSKLRMEARKWILSKLAPKKYGDLQRLEMSGPDGAPLLTETEASARMASIFHTARARIENDESDCDLI